MKKYKNNGDDYLPPALVFAVLIAYTIALLLIGWLLCAAMLLLIGGM